MLVLLDSKKSGSACSSGELESSETLKWLNYIDGTLRFSNTIEEIDIVCNEIEKIINRLK